MITRHELHQAIDEMNEEQLQQVARVIEVIQADPSWPHRTVDLTRYSGVLKLTEDPLGYQERMRTEWP